ncbi:MAG: sigma-70 family RNA polymerase sigma factor [Bacilli bacterium]|nr:sigma-70 family RNA polymerase sigma factor [Bacilli bacterium]MBQ3307574.1 sigma-70 family RNA polymerase sigma factor [Bacilli bacterium]
MVYSSVEGMIDNIVEVVQRMFFFYVYDKDTIDDLKQEGYLMAYELLAKGEYDPSKNLRNYLFTGVRNAMTNYMYKKNKTKNDISNDTLEDAAWQDYMNVVGNDYYVGKVYTHLEYQEDYRFTQEDLKRVTDKFENFGKDLLQKSEARLAKRLAINTRVNVKQYTEDDGDIPLVYNAIMGEVIWEKVMSLI